MPIKCAICKKAFKGKESTTVSQAWIDAGGYGQVPRTAIVHAKCDQRDYMRKKRARGEI